MDTLPICQAKSKQSGMQCRNFSVKSKLVCHIHGGKSSGSRTKKGRLAQQKANFKHGLRSKEFAEDQRNTRDLIKRCKSLIG